MENVAGKWTVVGAGTGSGDPKQNSDSVDTKNGDYPKAARKSSPSILDVKLNMKGVDLLTDLRKSVKFDARSLPKYAVDESNGSAAKFKGLPNIGAFLYNGAPNATEFIRGLDPGNLSGAIKTGLDLAKNFSTSPFSVLSNMMGAGPLAGALSQIQEAFGAQGLVADALRTVGNVTSAINSISNLTNNLTPAGLAQNLSAIQNLPSLLNDPTLNLPESVKTQAQQIVNQISNDATNNNMQNALAAIPSLLNNINQVSSAIAPLASKLSSVEIPKLNPADLAKDFAGQLTEIKIPSLPQVTKGKATFPQIPTFDMEQGMKAAATAQALSSALSSLPTKAAGAADAVRGTVQQAQSRIT